MTAPSATIAPMEGTYYAPIDAELKERFLELIAEGFIRPEAARKLEQTGTRFKRICNPDSQHYDADFAKRYDELTRAGGEHRRNFQERLEALALKYAEEGQARLIEKLLVIHHPEWEALRPSNFKMEVSIEKLAVLLPGLSTETLDSVIQELESRKPELRALPDVIDA
jgi:hypothetical protein